MVILWFLYMLLQNKIWLALISLIFSLIRCHRNVEKHSSISVLKSISKTTWRGWREKAQEKALKLCWCVAPPLKQIHCIEKHNHFFQHFFNTLFTCHAWIYGNNFFLLTPHPLYTNFNDLLLFKWTGHSTACHEHYTVWDSNVALTIPFWVF